MNPFAMVMRRRPASLKSANTRYKEAIGVEAQKIMANSQRLQGRLYAHIVWFEHQSSRRNQDVDNIIKPILDGLKGIVFEDDIQIGECSAIRISVEEQFEWDGVWEDGATLQLQNWLPQMDIENAHLVYMEIGAAPNQVAYRGRGKKP